jgi:hypothetical protein
MNWNIVNEARAGTDRGIMISAKTVHSLAPSILSGLDATDGATRKKTLEGITFLIIT